MANRTKTPRFPKTVALLASTSLLALALVTTPITLDPVSKTLVAAKAKADDGGGSGGGDGDGGGGGGGGDGDGGRRWRRR